MPSYWAECKNCGVHVKFHAASPKEAFEGIKNKHDRNKLSCSKFEIDKLINLDDPVKSINFKKA